VADAHVASDHQVFVDMAGRFDPATEVLETQFSIRTAPLWERYEPGLASIDGRSPRHA
jgi:hypothetical protein